LHHLIPVQALNADSWWLPDEEFKVEVIDFLDAWESIPVINGLFQGKDGREL